MKLIYIWDAYCGWCYGFESILVPFLAAHPELDLEFVSGGLFDQGTSLKDYPYMAEANQRITQVYGVEFGQAYNDLLKDGSMQLASIDAATGFALLRDQLPQDKWAPLAQSMQKAFYQEGRSLSDPALYQELAETFGLDGQAIRQAFEAADRNPAKGHPDYQRAAELGAQSYPTLILEKDGKYYNLLAHVDGSLESLEKSFQAVLAQ